MTLHPFSGTMALPDQSAWGCRKVGQCWALRAAGGWSGGSAEGGPQWLLHTHPLPKLHRAPASMDGGDRDCSPGWEQGTSHPCWRPWGGRHMEPHIHAEMHLNTTTGRVAKQPFIQM